MNELALFAGAGGGILGGHLLGWRTVCAVEWEPYPASVLLARQNDGLLPPFPVWDDVRTFDGRPWRGIVDVVSGGFPCQDISAAGKGAGIDGERSGLWGEMARIIGEVRPRYVFVENSPLLVGRGLVRVLADLAEMGFDARWGVVGADDVGAPHRRERCWIVAHTNGRNAERGQSQRPGIHGAEGSQGADHHAGGSGEESAHVAHATGDGRQQGRTEPERREGGFAPFLGGASVPHADRNQHQGAPHARSGQRKGTGSSIIWGDWATEPDVGRVAHGVAARVDRLKALGNGQVPQCAAEAWRILSAGD